MGVKRAAFCEKNRPVRSILSQQDTLHRQLFVQTALRPGKARFHYAVWTKQKCGNVSRLRRTQIEYGAERVIAQLQPGDSADIFSAQRNDDALFQTDRSFPNGSPRDSVKGIPGKLRIFQIEKGVPILQGRRKIKRCGMRR